MINLSWGIAWVDSAGHPRNPELETDTAQQRRDRAGVATYRRLFEDALDAVVAGGGDPLVIVAAGNDGINAWWSGLPAAAAAGAKHANRVLVVGASRRDDSFAPWSNDSALVEVAAPGQGLTLLWGNGTVGTTRTRPSGIVAGGNGTSFSAPYVAGVAGLLFSFDPRLTAAETKRLIISGALQGNRTAGGIPILNARESLILAGQRTGAPLCGNRMWVDASNTLQVERASGDEALFSHPDLVTVTPFHGGKRIDYYTGWTYIPWYLDREGTLTFDGATWTDGPPGPATGLDLGAGQLRRGRSHGGDTSAVAMHRSLAGGATLMDLKVWASSDTVAPTVDTYPSVYHTGAATSNSPAISSDGERIATAVPYQSLGTGIYRYRIYVHERRTGTSTVLLEEDGRSMEVDSYSEDGTEIVLRYETGVGTTPDVLQYHSATTGALLRRVSTARFSGRGGYAPDRLPEGGR